MSPSNSQAIEGFTWFLGNSLILTLSILSIPVKHQEHIVVWIVKFKWCRPEVQGQKTHFWFLMTWNGDGVFKKGVHRLGQITLRCEFQYWDRFNLASSAKSAKSVLVLPASPLDLVALNRVAVAKFYMVPFDKIVLSAQFGYKCKSVR